jgi:hypothetical protein
MTLTLSVSLQWLEGFLVGSALVGVLIAAFLVLLASFGKWRRHPFGWLNPARAAAARRAFKLVFFPVLGAVITNATSWTAATLVNLHVDPTLANAGGVLVGAAVGGWHQGATWVTTPQDAANFQAGGTLMPSPASSPAPPARIIDPALTDAPVV